MSRKARHSRARETQVVWMTLLNGLDAKRPRGYSVAPQETGMVDLNVFAHGRSLAISLTNSQARQLGELLANRPGERMTATPEKISIPIAPPVVGDLEVNEDSPQADLTRTLTALRFEVAALTQSIKCSTHRTRSLLETWSGPSSRLDPLSTVPSSPSGIEG